MKKTLPLPSYVKTAIRLLNNSGYQAYVVGGAVRSLLLGTAVHDYDLTTNALPAQMKQVFAERKMDETGLAQGSLKVWLSDQELEITTYRREENYKDHRHPETVEFTDSLEEDLKRRDFTINALCYHPKEGIIDYFGGQMDLQNFILRCIGDPAVRFEEDALRIIRAVRFAAQLGFEIEPCTKKALLSKEEELSYITQERLSDELIRILEAPYFRSVLEEYRSLFEILMPELRELSDEQYQAVCASVTRSTPAACVRLALVLASLNDLDRASMVMERMRLSKDLIHDVLALLKYRNAALETRIDLRKLLNRLEIPFETYINFRSALEPSVDQEKLLSEYQAMIRNKDCWNLKQLDVNGRDMKKLGLTGPQISKAMNAALYEVMEERLPNQKESILEFVKKMEL